MFYYNVHWCCNKRFQSISIKNRYFTIEHDLSTVLITEDIEQLVTSLVSSLVTPLVTSLVTPQFVSLLTRKLPLLTYHLCIITECSCERSEVSVSERAEQALPD